MHNLHYAPRSAWGEIQCPNLGSQCGPRCWRLPVELPWKGDITELTGNTSVVDCVLLGTKGKRNEWQRMSFSLLPKSEWPPAAQGYHVGGGFSLGFLFFSFLMNWGQLCVLMLTKWCEPGRFWLKQGIRLCHLGLWARLYVMPVLAVPSWGLTGLCDN